MSLYDAERLNSLISGVFAVEPIFWLVTIPKFMILGIVITI